MTWSPPPSRETRYTWLKNPENLTGEQYARMVKLSELNRNPETFKTMIYLIGGRLQFNLPIPTH